MGLKITFYWGELADNKYLIALLFVLIGLAMHLLNFSVNYFLFGLIVTFIVLFARFISVIVPYSWLKHEEKSPIKTLIILTRGGLLGGISIALTLSLSNEFSGNLILHITNVVVLFSIIFQGLIIGRVTKKIHK